MAAHEIIVEGCPLADGKTPCPHCGGGWFDISTEKLTAAVLSGRIVPEKLCGPLEARATAALVAIQQKEILFTQLPVSEVIPAD